MASHEIETLGTTDPWVLQEYLVNSMFMIVYAYWWIWAKYAMGLLILLAAMMVGWRCIRPSRTRDVDGDDHYRERSTHRRSRSRSRY